MAKLVDRVLFDISAPGWKPGEGHPAAAFPRPWNHRELVSKVDAAAVDARLVEMSERVLAHLGVPRGKGPAAAKRLGAFNLVPWHDLGRKDVSVVVRIHDSGPPSLAIEGTMVIEPRHAAKLSELGFVDLGPAGWARPGFRISDRELRKVFPKAGPAALPESAVAVHAGGVSPFGAAPEGQDVEAFREWLDAAPVAGPSGMSAETALGLCRAAAVLHADDCRSEGVSLGAMKGFVEGLRDFAGTVRSPRFPAKDADPLSLGKDVLAAVSKLRTAFAGLTAETAVAAVGVRWIAVAYYEALCRRAGTPPEAGDELWDWNPFADAVGDDLAPLRRQREVALDCERLAAGLAGWIARGMTTFEDLVEVCRSEEVSEALKDACEALPEGKGLRRAVAGHDLSRIRLAWDVLAIWMEARPGVRPTIGVASPYALLVSDLFCVATGASLDEDNVASNHERMSGIFTRPVQKAVISWIAQREGDSETPPVAVGNPVGAEGGRFLSYLRKPYSSATAGPAAWRGREAESKSIRKG